MTQIIEQENGFPTSLGGRGHGGSYGSLLRCAWSMLGPTEVTVPALSWC